MECMLNTSSKEIQKFLPVKLMEALSWTRVYSVLDKSTAVTSGTE